MCGHSRHNSRRPWRELLAAAVMLAAVVGSGRSHGQAPATGPAPAVFVTDSAADSGVVPAGCSSCGGGPGGHRAGCGDGGCGPGGCYAGYRPCDCLGSHDGPFGKLFGGIYHCICCPDPCYEPVWVAAANNAFFVDAARPITQTRLRYDNGWDLKLPDRAEFFWAAPGRGGKGPKPAVRSLSHRDLSLYVEGAAGAFGGFVETLYREVDPEVLPNSSGFGDMNVGAKTLLLDCELLQFATQFRTYIPIASPSKGLGTGHVSLEPSLLFALKLFPDCYLQGQVSYWIPVGGDSGYQGNVFHYHFSANRVLCKCGHDIQLIGNVELNGWQIMNGRYTDPATGTALGAYDVGSILSAGPGVRLVFCDKIDFGVGTAFSITNDQLEDHLLRAEFRWRY